MLHGVSAAVTICSWSTFARSYAVGTVIDPDDRAEDVMLDARSRPGCRRAPGALDQHLPRATERRHRMRGIDHRLDAAQGSVQPGASPQINREMSCTRGHLGGSAAAELTDLVAPVNQLDHRPPAHRPVPPATATTTIGLYPLSRQLYRRAAESLDPSARSCPMSQPLKATGPRRVIACHAFLVPRASRARRARSLRAARLGTWRFNGWTT